MRCSVCNKEIDVFDSEEDLYGDIYCIACYNKKCFGVEECIVCNTKGEWTDTDTDGDYYCPDCFKNSTKLCAECGEIFKKEDTKIINGDCYCESCINENFFTCEFCGKIFPNDESYGTPDDSGLVCEDCFNSNYIICDDCGDTIRRDESYNVYGINNTDYTVCQRCRYNHYVECDGCGDVIHCDNVYYSERNECDYCENCYPGDSANLDCHDYGYKPSPIFHNLNEKLPRTYYGVEMEVESSGDSWGINDIIYQIKNLSNNENLFYIKTDCSLNCGFEIVTHPCTLNYHKDMFPWDNLETRLEEEDCDGDTRSCGLHIHVSKRIFSSLDLIKLALFVFHNNNIPNIETIARRKYNTYCHKKNIENSPKKNLRYSNSRFEAVNFSNEKTVEFRMFKGTIRKNVVIASLEFVESVTNFIKIQSISNLIKEDSWGDYISYLIENGKKYKNLITYMKEKFENTLNN